MNNSKKLIDMILLLDKGKTTQELQQKNLFELTTLWRSLMNIAEPSQLTTEYLTLEDQYLSNLHRPTKTLEDCQKYSPQVYLYKGDLTVLEVDGIVNPANSDMLGCFIPNHHCLDNAIHTFAGSRLRLACLQMMQGKKEPVGQARLTRGYHLPCLCVLHTVGPFVQNGRVTAIRKHLLKQCYESCLNLAQKEGLGSLAFCCISTGEFGFPKKEAAEIAIETVLNWLNQHETSMKIIFSVYTEEDQQYYHTILHQRGGKSDELDSTNA